MASSRGWYEYLDIVSDDCMNVHADNTPGSFINELATPQELPENTYCSLQELEMVYSMYNVETKTDYLTFLDALYKTDANTPENDENYPIFGRFIGVPLPEGNYQDHDEFCIMLNKAIRARNIPGLEKRDVFSYDKRSHKFSYDLSNTWLTMFLRGDLITMVGARRSQAYKLIGNSYISLGMSKLTEKYTYTDSKGKTEERVWAFPKFLFDVSEKKKKDHFPHAAQLSLVSSLAVYVDFLASVPIGSQFTDCLRIVPLKKQEFGTHTVIQFEHEYLLKVSKRHIASIKCEIRSLSGRVVNFNIGRTRLKLRFVVKDD